VHSQSLSASALRPLLPGVRTILGLLVFALLSPGAGWGQSVTGRVRDPELQAREPGRLVFCAGAGVFTSGDLFKITARSGEASWWALPAAGRFYSAEFIVTIDDDLLVNGGVSYQLDPVWALKLDVGWTEANATVEAQVGQTVELYLYDRLTFILGALSVERALLQQSSYPFLQVGAVLVNLSAQGAAGLDQTLWGGRFGVGYHHAFDQRWGFRFEIRDTIRQLDTGAHTDLLTNPEESLIEQRGPQNLFEILALVRGRF
jgi:hypothetical protein